MAHSLSAHRPVVRPVRAAIAAAAGLSAIGLSLVLASEAVARTRSETVPAAAKPQAAPAKDPLVVVVSLRRQRLTVYNRNGSVAESPISSGNSEFPTITGVFSIIGKSVEHESNIYEGAQMPFMQRLTWTGTALHAGHLPGYPASHGCIRLPYGFAQRLFDMTAINTRVIVTNGDVVPQPIDHAKLPGPAKPDGADAPVATLGSRIASLAPIGTAYAAPQPVYSGDVALTAQAKARFSETQKLFDAIAPVEQVRNAAFVVLKGSTKAVNLARLEVQRLDEAEQDGLKAVARIKRSQQAIESQLEAIGRKVGSARNERALEALAKAEEAAEARLFDLASELELAEDALESVKSLRSSLQAKVDAALDIQRADAETFKTAHQALKDAQASFALAKREDARYMRPVSVLISRKDQRLYVRQGFEPVLEVPIEIVNPDVPLGTHVYTAMSYRDGGAALTWTSVSLPTKATDDVRRSERAMVTASGALDRISFPPEAHAAIVERMKPGSSLIVTDDTTSQYFGNGTDFTINTR
jgi:hypothetical protein